MENMESLAHKLDMLIRLSAIQALGDRTGTDAIGVLVRAGLDNELIADLVGTTPATVRSARSRVRKKGS